MDPDKEVSERATGVSGAKLGYDAGGLRPDPWTDGVVKASVKRRRRRVGVTSESDLSLTQMGTGSESGAEGTGSERRVGKGFIILHAAAGLEIRSTLGPA